MNNQVQITRPSLPEAGPCSRRQVAAFFGISTMTVMRWEESGKLDAPVKIENTLRHEAKNVWRRWNEAFGEGLV